MFKEVTDRKQEL